MVQIVCFRVANFFLLDLLHGARFQRLLLGAHVARGRAGGPRGGVKGENQRNAVGRAESPL